MVVTHLKSFCKPARGGVTKLPNPQPMKNIEDTSRKMLMTTVMMMSWCHDVMMSWCRDDDDEDSDLLYHHGCFFTNCENDSFDKSKHERVFTMVNGKKTILMKKSIIQTWMKNIKTYFCLKELYMSITFHCNTNCNTNQLSIVILIVILQLSIVKLIVILINFQL